MKKLSFIFLSVSALLTVVMISCNGNNNAATNQQQSSAATIDRATQQPQATSAQPDVNNLPEEITSFVKDFFPNATIAYVKAEKEYNGNEIDLTLNDGTEIDFDTSKQWEKVECKNGSVPEKIVPQAIASYVKANHQGQAIIKIDKDDHGGFEIELSNGIELNFDQAGKFLNTDND